MYPSCLRVSRFLLWRVVTHISRAPPLPFPLHFTSYSLVPGRTRDGPFLRLGSPAQPPALHRRPRIRGIFGREAEQAFALTGQDQSQYCRGYQTKVFFPKAQDRAGSADVRKCPLPPPPSICVKNVEDRVAFIVRGGGRRPSPYATAAVLLERPLFSHQAVRTICLSVLFRFVLIRFVEGSTEPSLRRKRLYHNFVYRA